MDLRLRGDDEGGAEMTTERAEMPRESGDDDGRRRRRGEDDKRGVTDAEEMTGAGLGARRR